MRTTLPDMCSFFGFFRVHLMTDGVNKKSWDRIIIDSTNTEHFVLTQNNTIKKKGKAHDS